VICCVSESILSIFNSLAVNSCSASLHAAVCSLIISLLLILVFSLCSSFVVHIASLDIFAHLLITMRSVSFLLLVLVLIVPLTAILVRVIFSIIVWSVPIIHGLFFGGLVDAEVLSLSSTAAASVTRTLNVLATTS